VTRSNYIVLIYCLVPLFIHLMSAICCLGCSSLYHLFKDMHEECNHTLARLDYCGISILIAGSSTSPIYYSFFCEENKCNPLFKLILFYSLALFIYWAHILLQFDVLHSLIGTPIRLAKVHGLKRDNVCHLRPPSWSSYFPH
jgi:predicted membrane channel-forming protein YqfA (hemolysin III family)